MKKIISILTLVSVLAAGCTALDENPSTKLSEKTIFSTEAGLESAMVGCYQTFKATDLWQGRLFEYLQCASILVHWKGNRVGESWQQGLHLTMYSTDTYNQNAFSDAYAGINCFNNLIDNLADSPVDKAYKLQIEGEAKLLRAVMYFHCVRMWGDLPLAVNSPRSLEEANIPRTSYLDVYKQILDDLTFAEENMRSFDEQKAINGTASRACKFAATAYKACVYAQIGCILSSPDDQPFKAYPDFSNCGISSEKEAWTQALACADKVIKEGPYKLADKFGDLFKWTNPEDWQLLERVFVIPSSDLCSTSLSWAMPDYLGGTQHTDAKASSYGRIRPERWLFQKWAATYGGELGTGRKDGMTNVYINCKDPRFDASFIHTSYYYQKAGSEKNLKIYPSDACVTGIDASNATGTRIGAPYYKKYVDPLYNATNGNADHYMLRFAEMYLIAAEACASLSDGPGSEYWNKAFDYIEVLHKRARHSVESGPDSDMPKWTTDRFSSRQELLDAIFWERMYELCGEGHEFFDIRRRGAQWVIDNLCIPMNAFLKEPEQGPNVGAEDVLGYWNTLYFKHQYATTVEEIRKGLLCAFPDSEIRNNSAIDPSDQNPYFIK